MGCAACEHGTSEACLLEQGFTGLSSFRPGYFTLIAGALMIFCLFDVSEA